MDIIQKRAIFEEEYSRLFDDIYRYILYRIPHEGEAEDLVGEIFMSAYEKLESFNKDLGSLRTWVFQIAKNKMIDYWRRRKLVINSEEIICFFDSLNEKSFSGEIDDQLLTEKIFAKLNPEMKILFTLRYIDDLPYEEIAQLTGKKVETLRKSFSRIHAKLRLEFID